MNTMHYKSYAACVDFDERDNIFVGRVFGVSSIISFHGETVDELHVEFEKAVDDFLADCAERGVAPEKPAKQGYAGFLQDLIFEAGLHNALYVPPPGQRT